MWLHHAVSLCDVALVSLVNFSFQDRNYCKNTITSSTTISFSSTVIPTAMI